MGVPGYCLVSGENREGASESGCRRVTGWIGVKVREADVYACYSWVNGMARITINTIDSRLLPLCALAHSPISSSASFDSSNSAFRISLLPPLFTVETSFAFSRLATFFIISVNLLPE